MNETFRGIPDQTEKKNKPSRSRSLRWTVIEGVSPSEDTYSIVKQCFYTMSIQVPIFLCIFPRSLQPIGYEKIYAVRSNELAKGYTLIPMTIFIDKYLGATL